MSQEFDVQSERTAKWNEGLHITDDLDEGGRLLGGRLPDPATFPWGRSN